MTMKQFIGRRYGDLTEEENNFIETKRTGEYFGEGGKRENGECTFDFEDNVSIPGMVLDTDTDQIEWIEDDAAFYSSEG